MSERIEIMNARKEKLNVPAKRADMFEPGEVILRDFGYTWKVVGITTLSDGVLCMRVEHVPEEAEFWDGASEHDEYVEPGKMLAIGERHGNEGLC